MLVATCTEVGIVVSEWIPNTEHAGRTTHAQLVSLTAYR
jgi:hypothetical protein